MSIRALGSRELPALRRFAARAGPSTARLAFRAFSASRCRSDIASELEKQLNPRELIEKKRKLYEEKYGDKLKKRVEQ